MQLSENPEREERDALARRQLVMRIFRELLQATRLPPMVVLEYAAAAVGSVYCEVAEAHTWPQACPCGWQPDETADITCLQEALLREALEQAHYDLAAT